MKPTLLSIFFSLILLIGCDDQTTNPKKENSLNLIYNLLSDDYTNYTVEEIRVFESTTTAISKKSWKVLAMANLPVIEFNKEYPSSYNDLEVKVNELEKGRFTELANDKYKVDGDKLLINHISPDRTYAISFIIHRDLTNKMKIGGFIEGSNSDSVMALQLVKRPNFDVIDN